MMKKFGFIFAFATLSAGAWIFYGSSSPTIQTRSISSTKTAELAGDEEQEFYHITEGSDIFPYDWLIRIKSAFERDRVMSWERGFFDGIDTRVNILKNPNPNKYLMDFIGLSSSWSSHSFENADALKSDPETSNDEKGKVAKLRYVGEIPSIRMVGVNCAFCHTGRVQVGDETKIINGSQAEVNLQRLYGDMVISTLALLINYENQLEEFLVAFAYPREEAKEIAKKFGQQTLKETSLGKKIKLLLISFGIKKSIEPWFLEGEEANIHQHFERLFRITHRLKPEQKIGNELQRRFRYLAKFANGHPKRTSQGGTEKRARFHSNDDGFGRLEAFISAGNRVFRERKDWVSNNAAVGFPAIWGIGNRAIFHYTGNTNSVLIRNIGQAMGLGAIELDDKYATTVNIPNLNRLENLAYKIKSPSWQEVFSPDFVKKRQDEFKIDTEKVKRGQVHYAAHCASCHDAQMVGPQKNLAYYPFSDLDEMGTDKNLAKQIVLTINNETEYSDIFAVTGVGIIERFISDHPSMNKDVNNWVSRDKRGSEWIRGSFNPTNDQDQGVADGFPVVPKKSGYVSRDLSGIFATAPYLHNNSVPTLWDLLQPTSKRPQLFERGVNEFDPKKVGLKQRTGYTRDMRGLVWPGKNKEFDTKKNCRAKPGHFAQEVWKIDVCLDTKVSGNSNAGHEYGVELKEFEKYELIEYLKTK